MLALAWLPALSYLGHWGALLAPIGGATPIASAASHGSRANAEEHARHCHGDLSECAGDTAGPAAATAPLLDTPLRAAAIAFSRVLEEEIAHGAARLAPLAPPPRPSA